MKRGLKQRNVEKKKAKRNTRKYWIIGMVGAIAAIFCVIALPLVTSKAASSAIIKIPRNATKTILRDTLTKYFGKEYSDKVAILLPSDTAKLATRHGAYEVKEGTSPAEAARTLIHGAQTPLRITINGVRNFDDFLPRIAARFTFSADSMRNVIYSEDFMNAHGLTDRAQLPALFLNDSYDFYWTAGPRLVAEKIIDNYESFWTPERVEKARDMGVTPLQLAIISSIVDEETNAQDEKGTVGRLYINRLNKGMRLQADPTVRFALGDFTIKRVTAKHLGVESPYNTYRVAGLPPGPIRTPSASTMQAILDSKPSEFLYMCAKEDFSGRHNFATSYEQHLQNADRYQRALDSLGIK